MAKVLFSRIKITINAEERDVNEDDLNLSNDAEEIEEQVENYVTALIRQKYPQFEVSITSD